MVNFLRRDRATKKLAYQRTSLRLTSMIDNYFGYGDFLRINMMEMVDVFMWEGRQSLELSMEN